MDQLYPVALDAGGDRLALTEIVRVDGAADIQILPADTVAGEEEDGFGGPAGKALRRSAADRPHVAGVRYYDPARDYQPGIQRTDGRGSQGRQDIVEFPATLAAGTAKRLAASAAGAGRAAGETISWRMAEIDPAIHPGALVRLPDRAGLWRVTEWEWRDRAVELGLVRHRTAATMVSSADPGASRSPTDLVAGPTVLAAFGLPWDGNGSPGTARLFAAASTGGTASVPIYRVAGTDLVPTGSFARGDALIGTLVAPLASSPSLRLEQGASLEIAFHGDASRLASAGIGALAAGANRLHVGGEVLQFAEPQPLGGNRWRLCGLLRGRGGTEDAAAAGHAQGSTCTVLDSRPASLDPSLAEEPEPGIAAIGLGDAEPVLAVPVDPAASLRPLSPVHPRLRRAPDGAVSLGWTRRARGAWTWRDLVDVPLVEEAESYLVGLGPVGTPYASWVATSPAFALSSDEAAQLAAAHPGAGFWVRQQGTFALSRPLALGHL